MIKDQKKQIRESILANRNALTPQEIKDAEGLIINNLLQLEHFLAAKDIFCYLSFRSEVPTEAIINYCNRHHKNVYIPVCITETKEMVISLYDQEVQLITSKYGVLEPSKDTIKLADRNNLDTVIVPGAVFDRRGYRIGYGAGYYDKFFSHSSKQYYKIALAYSFQVIDEVPRDDYDVPVDCIVTEKGIIMCGKQ